MALVHGKNTVFKVATKDLSAVTKTSEFTGEANVHEHTPYGSTAERNYGGLKKFGFKASGVYDSTAVTGPRAVLQPLLGTTVAVIRQPEGTGVGKPQDSFSAVLKSYVETNPANDYIVWSAEFVGDGDDTTTVQ